MVIWENINEAWKFTLMLTETAPLSVWQFFIAIIIPAAMYRHLRRAPCTTRWNRRFGRDAVDWALETAALLVGILVAWAPWPTNEGLLIGICAGLLSPYISNGAGVVVAFAWSYIRAKFGKTTCE